MSKDKSACNPEDFKAGEVIEAKITSTDKKNNKLNLSVKALELDEEKKVMESLKSTTNGSSFGDALGEALSKMK